MNGDKETGVTTFLLKHEIDTGNLIMQERLPIGEDENVGSVHDRLMALGTSVVLQTVDRIIDCENQGIALPTTPQPELAELRPAPKIFKEDCEIRFAEKTAEEIHNFVRGLSPYPAAWANLTINGQAFENVKIYKVEITELRNYGNTKSDLIVPCKEGAVRILELQAPGKKRMDAKSFLNGIHA
jgi:methionyl-tRNA formyltransferase